MAGALLLSMMGVLAWLSRLQLDRLGVANAWNVHTYQVLMPIAALRTALDDEGDLRNRALSSEEEPDRERALRAGRKSRELLRHIEELTADNPLQQKRLYQLEADLRAWELPIRTPSALLRSGAPRARELLSDLQGELETIGDTERQLLVVRGHAQDQTQRTVTQALTLGSLLGIAFAGALFGLLWRGARAQELAAREILLANGRLRDEVAARMQTQEQLRASEESYRHLADDSLDLICAHGADGGFLYLSPAALPMLGYAPEELVGQSPRDLFHPADFSAALSFREWLETGEKGVRAVRARRKDGSWVWLELVGHAVVHPESGRVTQFHTTARDVSARVREEARRQEMLDGLHATVRIADRLIEARAADDLLRLATELAASDLGWRDCQLWIIEEEQTLFSDAREPQNGAIPPELQGAYALTPEGSVQSIAHRHMAIPPELLPAARANAGERWNILPVPLPLVDAREARAGEALPPVAFPLLAGERLLGALFVSGEWVGAPGEARPELGRLFASLLATLLERVRSEERARQNEQLLATVVNNAPIGLYAAGLDERCTFAAGRGFDGLGFTAQSMVGRTIGQITGENSQSARGVRGTLRGEMTDGPSRLNGQEFDVFRRPVRDAAGDIVGMVGVLVDVTERARAQVALKQSEARYRGVVNSVTEVIFQTDRDARWVFLNAAWSEIMDYSIEESLGRSASEFLHPDDLDAVHAHAQAVATNENAPRRMTARYQTASAQVRWMEVFVRPLTSEDGEFEGFAGTLADITERYLAERALRETTQMQRAILGSASYAIFSCDADGLIQSFNRAAEEMLLLPASAVCGLVRAPLLVAAEELEARAQELESLKRAVSLWEALTLPALEAGREEREWTGIRSDGTRFPMKLSLSPLRGENDEVAGFVFIGTDLTESRRVEKLKSEFVSVVSHELRTPLTSIRGALGLLSGGVAGQLPDRATQMISIAYKNAERLVLLINDILDIEKIERGGLKFESAPLDLGDIVRAALQANTPYAANLDVSLAFEQGEGEALCMEGDEARLGQVMANLLSNAAKFTPAGGQVRVHARRVGARTGAGANAVRAAGIAEAALGAGKADWVCVEVFDGGAGVPPEFVPRLFSRFAQADASATRATGGTGLGLAISRAIIEKMGGVLRYTPPDPATGAPHSFNFWLPLAPDTSASVSAQAARRERLLICEDDLDVALYLGVTLEAQGFDVTQAPDLATARAALGRDSFDAMTLDLSLSDGDGLEFLEELRSEGFDLPVVVVSAYSDARKAGNEALDVLDWLQKPVDSASLQGALARLKTGPNGRARILHVEDDADIRHVTRAVLGSKVEVREAATLQEARELLRAERFDMVLLDIGLPDGDGLELLPLLAAQTPPVPVALFSAQEAEGIAGRSVAAALVKSRSNNATLRSTVERLLRMEPDALGGK